MKAPVHGPAPTIPSITNNNVKQEPGLINSTAVTSMSSTVNTITTTAPTPAPAPVLTSLSQVQVPTPILQTAVSVQTQQKPTLTAVPPQVHPAHTTTQPVKITTRTSTTRTSASHAVTHATAAVHPHVHVHRPTASKVPTVGATIAPPSKTSKKKKATVSMATAQSATSSNQGENTGRWTAEEHRLFLQGLEQHGKGWKKIASLIKSRTVVQIRTHAQKYFQKLAKARQNGDEGEVSMENRERIVAPSGNPKRRRSGTKRKAITSVVASAERHSKKMAAKEKKKNASATAATIAVVPQESIALHSVAPALTPFVSPMGLPPSFNTTAITNTVMNAHSSGSKPNDQHDGQVTPTEQMSSNGGIPSITTNHGTISVAALEDSLFRFLTPMPNETHNSSTQVNDIARQAGANPITLPSEHKSAQHVAGEVSPTVVVDFPSNWAWTNDAPSWYSKGADVDELLNEAEALDWLADSGDLNETYNPPPAPVPVPSENHQMSVSEPSLLSLVDPVQPSMDKSKHAPTHVAPSAITNAPAPMIDSSDTGTGVVGIMPRASSGANMPPLQSLFESGHNLNGMKKEKSMNISSASLFESASAAADAAVVEDNFHLLDTPFDEQAFVTALLDQNSGDSSANLNNLTK